MNCMTQPQSGTAAFRAARDLLLRHREDFGAAAREFSWPQLSEFNWALDWFDVVAAEHPGQEALRIVTEDGVTARSYGELVARSNQLATWLRGLGARRGDRLLLMLGNIAPLWEVILASIKLGVVIIPASTLLGPEDLADRIDRGEVRHVVTEAAHKAKFAGLPGDWTRVLVEPSGQQAGATAGETGATAEETGRWHRYADAFAGPADVRARRADQGERSAAALFHLRYHRASQAGPAHPCQLSGRASVDRVYARPATRRRAPEHLLSGLGEARLEQCLFAPWNVAATVLILQPSTLLGRVKLLRALARSGVTTFCAPPTVWRMLIQTDLGAYQTAFVSWSRPANRSTPRSSSRSAGPGASPSVTATARPRRPPWWATPLASRSSWARWAGRCPATRWCWSTRTTGRQGRGRALPGPGAPPARPDDRLSGRPGARRRR